VSGPPRITWAPAIALLVLAVVLLWLGYLAGLAYVQHLYSAGELSAKPGCLPVI
jgi:hypothetical protein